MDAKTRALAADPSLVCVDLSKEMGDGYFVIFRDGLALGPAAPSEEAAWEMAASRAQDFR